MMKQVVEKALQAELSHHLDEDSAAGNANSRNGFMAKTLKSNFEDMPIPTPRDQAGALEASLIISASFKPISRASSAFCYILGLENQTIAVDYNM